MTAVYRTGEHNGHLVYRGMARRSKDEVFVAACMTAELAAELVEVLNGVAEAVELHGAAGKAYCQVCNERWPCHTYMALTSMNSETPTHD